MPSNIPNMFAVSCTASTMALSSLINTPGQSSYPLNDPFDYNSLAKQYHSASNLLQNMSKTGYFDSSTGILPAVTTTITVQLVNILKTNTFQVANQTLVQLLEEIHQLLQITHLDNLIYYSQVFLFLKAFHRNHFHNFLALATCQ